MAATDREPVCKKLAFLFYELQRKFRVVGGENKIDKNIRPNVLGFPESS